MCEIRTYNADVQLVIKYRRNETVQIRRKDP